jgi:hypothetical protein
MHNRSVNIRDRQVDLDIAEKRELGTSSLLNPVVVGQVFAAVTIPTASQVYYSVHPVSVAGAESEGGAGVLTVDAARSFLVYLVGSTPAVAGDYLLCRFIGNRWVAERMRSATAPKINLLGCPCQVPSTLNMSVPNPSMNFEIFQSATIQWMPVPPALAALQLGPSAFLSTALFTDQLSTYPFRYQLFCSGGFFSLTRVFEQSDFGSPFREAFRYRWLPGLFGGTCTPFLFPQGQVFQGGNLGTVVALSG